MVYGQPVNVSLSLREGVSCNTIFLWLFLQKHYDSIITKNNALVIGILGDQFNTYMMVPQISKESPKH